jgi:hypothetical protein
MFYDDTPKWRTHILNQIYQFLDLWDFLGLLICSNCMEQDFHIQDAEKYFKNVYKKLDTMKRNMDYTVWDQVELQQQPIMGMLQNDNWSYMDAGKLILRRTCMCTKVLRTDCLLLRILDFRYSIYWIPYGFHSYWIPLHTKYVKFINLKKKKKKRWIKNLIVVMYWALPMSSDVYVWRFVEYRK